MAVETSFCFFEIGRITSEIRESTILEAIGKLL